MDDADFPLYRKSANDLNWYRIASATEFTEVQRVGSRYVAHHVRALIYPERVRIMELITMENAHVEVCEVSEFKAVLAQCRE